MRTRMMVTSLDEVMRTMASMKKIEMMQLRESVDESLKMRLI